MSLNAPDYTNPLSPLKQAYEDGIREGRRQMLDEMLKFHNQKQYERFPFTTSKLPPPPPPPDPPDIVMLKEPGF